VEWTWRVKVVKRQFGRRAPQYYTLRGYTIDASILENWGASYSAYKRPIHDVQMEPYPADRSKSKQLETRFARSRSHVEGSLPRRIRRRREAPPQSWGRRRRGSVPPPQLRRTSLPAEALDGCPDMPATVCIRGMLPMQQQQQLAWSTTRMIKLVTT
jgi:hypothetical protein